MKYFFITNAVIGIISSVAIATTGGSPLWLAFIPLHLLVIAMWSD